MNKKVLKIDLDMKNLNEAVELIRNRLCYMNDINFLNSNAIDKIVFLHKTTYGCKIFLNIEFEPLWIVSLQLLLGSDYQKETNTLINHFKLKMDYSNRLFTVKRYSDGKIKIANEFDMTKKILKFVNDKNRKKNYN